MLIKAMIKATATIAAALAILALLDRLTADGWLVVQMLLAAGMLTFIYYEVTNENIEK